jgi:hypothetical protein
MMRWHIRRAKSEVNSLFDLWQLTIESLVGNLQSGMRGHGTIIECMYEGSGVLVLCV